MRTTIKNNIIGKAISPLDRNMLRNVYYHGMFNPRMESSIWDGMKVWGRMHEIMVRAGLPGCGHGLASGAMGVYDCPVEHDTDPGLAMFFSEVCKLATKRK